MKNKHFLMLQLFAEDGGAEGSEGAENNEGKGAEGEGTKKEESHEEKKYSDKDLDKIINDKFAKWQKKKEAEVDEAKKLAEMNAQQKAEYERDKLQKELDELKNKALMGDMTKEARKMLTESNISASDEIIGLLISKDADETKANVENFAKLFNEAVKKAVTEALRGGTPRSGSQSKLTRADIEKVENRAERQRLIKENINLWR